MQRPAFCQSLCQKKKTDKMAIFRFLFRFQSKYPCYVGDFLYLCTFIFQKSDLNYMKRIFALVVCLLLATVAFSQDNNGFFQNLKEKFVVHDTVYVYITSTDTLYVINDEEEEEEDEDEEFSESIPMPIDTLYTFDKFRKVILFDNNTWLYYNIEKPDIPTSISEDHWDTETIHSYRDIALKDLPDEVTIQLVDSVHGYCIPHPGPVTSQYKFRWRRPHKGVDIGLDTGDPVYAAFDGVVRVDMPTRMSGGYGNVIVIRHVNGLETYYGHLSRRLVQSGDIVKAGELIGYGGSTGRSTGPHLHLETRYMGQPFDPERIFDLENGTLRSEVFVLKKHYFSINSHYGMTDKQSLEASKKVPKDSASTSKKMYHTVRKGENLSKIAKRYGTTVNKICQLNGIRKNKALRVGQKLRVK